MTRSKNPLEQLKTRISKVRKNRDSHHIFSREQANRLITEVVADYLEQYGRFIHADDEAFWFSNEEHRMYLITKDCEAWITFMTTKLGINPADVEHKFVLNEIRHQILVEGEPSEVHLFSYYDVDRKVLFISRFDGMMYRLDRNEIDVQYNGTDGILFLDHQNYQPYEADFNSVNGLTLSGLLADVNFQQSDYVVLSAEQQRLVFLVWMYSLPFYTLLPTRPIALMVGPKGSGKTSLFRRVLRLLFGPLVDVRIMNKEKQDAFIAATSTHYLTVWDNVDEKVKWLNDHLATASTGGFYTLRKLYTTNTEKQYRARAFVGLTSRTPQFRRDDVSDRLLIFNVERIEDFIPEGKLLEEINAHRKTLLGEYLMNLKKVVGCLNQSAGEMKCKFRLADWGTLGLTICEALGGTEMRDKFSECLDLLSRSQDEFAIAEDSLYLAFRELINQGKHIEVDTDEETEPVRYTAKDLFDELKRCMKNVNEFLAYPNHQSMAKRLSNIKINIERLLNVKIIVHQRHARSKEYMIVEQ